ncbi:MULTISPECIES: FmdE family protein [Methanobacterium]|uniref:FmdE family protein n=1 Tax=Methanobacterium TaxID=2160 RepID=UPI0009F3A545|nr:MULTISPECIES: FmdE family protein [Methanobacterium]
MEKSKKICHFSEDKLSNTFYLPKNKNLQIYDLHPENKVFKGPKNRKFLDVEGKSEIFLNTKNRKFLDVVKFHGHICPGTAIGYMAGKIAIKQLNITDEKLLTIVENDSCSIDAVQVITGCTFGKGNLIFKDHGKHVYTFINKNTGDAVRLSLNKNIDEMYPEFDMLRDKIFSGSASSKDKMEFENQKNEITQKILDMPYDELFNIKTTEIEIPDKIQMFQSVKCDICGELVAVHRARIKKGSVMCIPCFDEYLKT